jgi:hypothetical protein
MMRVRRAQGGGGADGGELPIKHGGGATEGSTEAEQPRAERPEAEQDRYSVVLWKRDRLSLAKSV